ncbi:MAG: septum formation initiator family protein [Oscillospiraceae bacterium]|nr:septum formation initiator family protein [Oscillospiraceae bacterium]
MQNTKPQQKTKLTTVLLRLGVCVIGLYLVVSLITTQVEIVAGRNQFNAVLAEIETQKAQNTEIQRVLESSTEEELVERIARDKLGYARPDERIFMDMSGK